MNKADVTLTLLLLSISSLTASAIYGFVVSPQYSSFHSELLKYDVPRELLIKYRMGWYEPNLMAFILTLVALILCGVAYFLVKRQ